MSWLIKQKGAELYINDSVEFGPLKEAREFKTKGGAVCSITKYNKDYPEKFEDRTKVKVKELEYIEVNRQLIKIV